MAMFAVQVEYDNRPQWYGDKPMTTNNERGNSTEHAFHADRDRYDYDFMRCRLHEGWQQFNTHKDTSSFGVWVNPQLRQILMFTKGDEITINCPTDASYQDELTEMRAAYQVRQVISERSDEMVVPAEKNSNYQP